MGDIKKNILAYMNKSGKGENKEVLVPNLDRYLVYVKQESTYIGGYLLALLEEMMQEGTIAREQGSTISLTEQGKALSEQLSA